MPPGVHDREPRRRVPPHHPALVPFVQTDQGQGRIKGRVFEHKGSDVSFKIRKKHDEQVAPSQRQRCPAAVYVPAGDR